MIQHSPQCIEYTNRIKVEREKYTEEWPNHCPSCEGWGYSVHYENQSPLGSGYVWNEEIIDPCSSCIEEGKCPRCGTLQPGDYPFEDEGDKCISCGWVWDTKGMTPPPDGPCECEYRTWLKESTQ